MSLGKILVIDDERNIRNLLKNEMGLEGYDVETARDGEAGIELLNKLDFDVVLLDIELPTIKGLEVLKRLKYISPNTDVIMITGYADINSAVQSIKLGALEYIAKPFKLKDILALVSQSIARNHKKSDQAVVSKRPKSNAKNGFIRCSSQPMKSVYSLVDKVAPTETTVFIHGETGTGKDVLAKQIHQCSLRKNYPFVTVDCGLLSDSLAESELYGHQKGAFSGASNKRLGLVEESKGGTLFLDEIGNVNLDLQKKFLRFIETKQFRRIGETKERTVDVRIILATNLDLQEAVNKGTLREDLFYRINAIQIDLPPLRDRPEDIVHLVNHFTKTNPGNSRNKKFSNKTLNYLISYNWPGNIRELKSVVNKCLLFSELDTIQPNVLPQQIRSAKKSAKKSANIQAETLKEIEKEHIIKILHYTGGHQSRTAEILGINRKTLYKKIHTYKIFS